MTPERMYAMGSAYGNDYIQTMTQAPRALTAIQAVGAWQPAELHDAVLTVFGEISAVVHDDLQVEARAVASTIFNRKVGIDTSRGGKEDSLEALAAARAEYTEALETYEDMAKAPSRYKRELGGQEAYDLALAEAMTRYKDAKRQLGRAQKAANQASSEQIAQESYVREDRRGGRITLTDIVTNPGQYLGYEKGLADFQAFSGMSEPDRARNGQRWAVALAAVAELAAGATPDAFVEFRSNRDGKRRLKSSETRIGGNDFW